MVESVRPNLSGLEDVIYLGTDEWDALLAAGEGVSDDDVQRPTVGAGLR